MVEHALAEAIGSFRDECVFVQDGAPFHTSKVMKQRCTTQIARFCEKDISPPSSPNLKSRGFVVEVILEGGLGVALLGNTAFLKLVRAAALSNFGKGTLRR